MASSNLTPFVPAQIVDEQGQQKMIIRALLI